MKQFVLPEDYQGSDRLVVEGPDFHYLCNVRRFREGDEFMALDRRGVRYVATVVSRARDRCEVGLSVLGTSESGDLSVTLFQCLPKAAKMDQIVRQATEAGVLRIVPVISQHTVVNLEGKERKRLARWRRIVEEAVQQSRSPLVPAVEEPVRIATLERSTGNRGISLYFDSDGSGSKSLHRHLSRDVESVDVVIGPEGGLSPRDIDALRNGGFESAYLGRQVLRTETAAVYAVAAIRTIALEKEEWSIRSR